MGVVGGAEAAVTLTGVSKRHGQTLALDGVDLELRRGEIVGFVGPNGAGKTTLIKLVMGLARPSAGSGTVLGHTFGPGRRVSPHVGVMLEHPPFIENLSGFANLRHLAAIRGQAGDERVRLAIEQSGLDARDRRPVRAYSQGMRQRLAFAQAVMEEPPLLLLDEPTNGLDPHGIVQLREAIRAVAARGTAVLLASHLLSEVEEVCDRVLLVQAGRIRRIIDHAAIAQHRAELLRIVFTSPADADALERCGLVVESSADNEFVVRRDRSTPELVRDLVGAGARIEEICPLRARLEDVYLDEFQVTAS